LPQNSHTRKAYASHECEEVDIDRNLEVDRAVSTYFIQLPNFTKLMAMIITPPSFAPTI